MVYFGLIVKISEADHILGYLFPRLGLCINFNNIGLGYILGYFFTNSFGHPVRISGTTSARVTARKSWSSRAESIRCLSYQIVANIG
jgi:hypothetical protein